MPEEPEVQENQSEESFRLWDELNRKSVEQEIVRRNIEVCINAIKNSGSQHDVSSMAAKKALEHLDKLNA